MFRLLVHLLLPIVALFATPFWLWKTKKRGGLSLRLWEKLGRYDAASPPAKTGATYLHAVSVGEVNIARKLITAWAAEHPAEHFLIGVGTSTGFDLACQSPPPHTQVLYAPLDFSPFLKSLFDRYQPTRIVLIEAEVWPNMMALAKRRRIPVALANARLSQRSGRRLAKFRPLMGPSYRVLSWVGAQSALDVPRLAAVGIRSETIEQVGSIKFDPALATPAQNNFDATALLAAFGQGPVAMALSTHEGEELVFAKATAELPELRVVIVPRHMERRDSIVRSLQANGHQVVLRSALDPKNEQSYRGKILIVDSTGELPAFTKCADIAFVGKTLLARGGQNPCEAIAAKVPILAGPHLGNFEPLASELRASGGLLTVTDQSTLAAALTKLLADPALRESQSAAALACLEEHRGATTRSIAAMAKLT